MLSANIPLNKIQNDKFKQFLESFCNRKVPDESTLRKNYVCPVYNNVILQIKNAVQDQFLYIIVDETTDVRGRYIVNLLISVLNEKILPKPYLISTKQLEKTNSVEIVRFIHESLMAFLAPDILPTDKILVLIFYRHLIHLRFYVT